MTPLDVVDQELLERLQADFPLTPRPFAVLARSLNLEEAEVLARVRRLKEANVIRQISAIFDTRRLGYQSTLVAFHVADAALDDVAAQVSAHPGVSHNYARPHHYNLWFTLAVPPGQEVAAEIDRLARQTGVDDWLNLPALRVFKIKAHFKLKEGNAPRPAEQPDRSTSQTRAFTPSDIPLVRVLQRDLPVTSRPFAEAAAKLGLSEERLLDKARELEEVGIMRRFAAVLRHRRVGYTANGMGCWVVPEARIEEVGRRAAAFPEVSHCYQRPAYPPRWPYNLFTMIHGQSESEVEEIAEAIAARTDIEDYVILYSTTEFKKERVKYFVEEVL
jgi:DNA-binding Lrp family transcriptional regulator